MKKGKNTYRRGTREVKPSSEHQPQERKRGGDRKWLLLLAVTGVLTLASYFNSVTNRFVFDDIHLIEENRGIRGIEKIPPLLGIGEKKISYRPVRMVSYALDYSLNKRLWRAAGGYEGRDKGLNPWGYHISNIVYHLITSFLVFMVVLRLSAQRRIAFLAAGVFALHPVHTDSVTYLSGRRDILCALFYLLGFYLFLRYRATGKLRFIIATLLAYLLGLGSKEMAVSLPAVFLCYDLLEQFSGKAERINRVYFKELFLALKSTLLRGRYLYSLTFIGGIAYSYYKVFIKSPSYRSVYYGDSLATNFLTVGKVLVHYIRLLIYPVRLNADYSYNTFPLSSSFFEPATFFSFMVLGAVGYVVLRLMVRHKLLAFAGMWFFIALLPVCQIFPHHELLAEHYLYLPSFGFVLVSAVLIDSFFRETSYRYAGYAAFALLIILFAVRIVDRNRDWRNEVALWSKTVKTAPLNARVHTNLGAAYGKKGMLDEAISEHKKAIAINPRAKPHYNLGKIYEKKGEVDKAISEYKKAIAAKPRYAKAQYELGLLYGSKQGKLDEAISLFKKAVANNPALYKAHYALGVAYSRKGMLDDALSSYKTAQSRNPFYPKVYIGLGEIYTRKNMFDNAITAYKTAISIKPDYAEVYKHLAVAFFLKGDFKSAIEHCDKALELGYEINPQFLKKLESYR